MTLDEMKKYWEDPSMLSFEAKVNEVVKDQDRIGLVFDGTYFYPEGGGQQDHPGLGEVMGVMTGEVVAVDEPPILEELQEEM